MPDRWDEQAPGPQAGRAADPAHGVRRRGPVRRVTPGAGDCRKFAPSTRNYVAAKLMSQVGLRVNEACNLDLADVKWELAGLTKQSAQQRFTRAAERRS